jgi:hypothetical protein
MSRLLEILLTVIAASVAMIALPVACFLARSSGPASRVVFYEYLPLVEFAFGLLAAALGATLGASAARRLRTPKPRAASRWRTRLQWSAGALLFAWVLWPQLLAFPAHADVAARAAWARRHVRHYAALARVVGALPEVRSGAGRIVAIAPTGRDKHVFAREMDGDDMNFALEVVGEHGTGTFVANCTLDDFTVYDWRSGTWTFAGHTTRIDSVPKQVPPRTLPR